MGNEAQPQSEWQQQNERQRELSSASSRTVQAGDGDSMHVTTLPVTAMPVTAMPVTTLPVARRGSLGLEYWAEFLRSGLGLLFPHRCPLCEQPTSSGLYPQFCDSCFDDLRTDKCQLCSACGAPAAMSIVAQDNCAQCRGKRFMFDRAIPFGLYRGRLRDVVIVMKEPHAESLAAATGRGMAIQARDVLGSDMPDWIVAAPMHWRRRWRRRVNNAERLARAFAREADLELANRLVIGTRVTQKQSLLSVNQRRENVRGAFRVGKTVDLDGRHVGLVDDTMTTGATADEISRVLLRAGASRVTLFLAARGVSN